MLQHKQKKMRIIGERFLAKKIKSMGQKGLLILPTKTDFNEFEVVLVGDKMKSILDIGDTVRVASHVSGIPIEYDGELTYLMQKDDIALIK